MGDVSCVYCFFMAFVFLAGQKHPLFYSTQLSA